jgi:membrane protein DedA with SNARE-associated domain
MSLVGVVIAGTLTVVWLRDHVLRRWAGPRGDVPEGAYFCAADKFARAEVVHAGMKRAEFFFARLLPVIRHLISIPAGIIRWAL